MCSALRDDHHSVIHPLDLHVGQKLRMRRLLLNLTQEKLAKLVGLTFQQVQKYEHGSNRISASRLYEIAAALKVPVTYFFEDAPNLRPTMQGLGEPGQEPLEGQNKEPEIAELSNRETSELIRAFYRIKDTNRRKKVLDLIRSMADEE